MRMCLLWLELGYTVNYSLSPWEIPLAPPSDFPQTHFTVYCSSRHNTDTVYHSQVWNNEINLYIQARDIFHSTLHREYRD